MKNNTVVLSKNDLTACAHDLGVWAGLTVDAGLPADTEEIEIALVRRIS